MKKQYTTRGCNKCKLRKCNCSNVIINKPVEVKASQAGNDGLDNYELALLEGFVGTRKEYLDSLKGGDGNSIEIRYARNDSFTENPPLNRTERYPNGWTLEEPEESLGKYVWAIIAMVTKEVPSELVENWKVVRLTGVEGVGEYLIDELE